ncbi:hypothetical protein GCM10022243_14520 [Saccharothrix violaceirubra]|uniref:Secreted protein n=1 Tax=Saccharothrix violaceirubra TaxID=413306 RepID=A0A7W7T676_9PSEU|nr:hypothetical protein [Saccharothrix violaceirubra]MBB4967327.1 hypothetical protein [Saccharothrix violaceirubra]
MSIKRVLTTLGVVVAAVLAMVTVSTGTGFAEPTSAQAPVAVPGGGMSALVTYHWDCPGLVCERAIPPFPGGTMSIDVDANGQGKGTWLIFNKWNDQLCRTEFDLVAPAQSWTCGYLEPGNYRLFLVINNYQHTTYSWMAARW